LSDVQTFPIFVIDGQSYMHAEDVGRLIEFFDGEAHIAPATASDEKPASASQENGSADNDDDDDDDEFKTDLDLIKQAMQSIADGFDWAASHQGFDYWLTVYTALASIHKSAAASTKPQRTFSFGEPVQVKSAAGPAKDAIVILTRTFSPNIDVALADGTVLRDVLPDWIV